MNNFSERAKQARHQDQIDYLDQRLNEIENRAFAHSKEKLDAYTKCILVAHLVENQCNTDEIKYYLGKQLLNIDNKIDVLKKNQYSNLTPKSAFMLQWGWTLVAIPLLATLWIGWWFSQIKEKSEYNQKIESRIKALNYDPQTDRYFILEDQSTKEKQNGEKRIYLKP